MTTASGTMLETRDLTKRYGTLTAVDRLSISLNQGEIVALLGANGAGKSTTIAMILGTLHPTSGDVLLFGQRMEEDPIGIKRRLGVVPENQSFYDEMTAWDYLMFFAELYRSDAPAGRTESLMTKLDLWRWRGTRIGKYSMGMRRKLGIVRALVHEPDLLVLDEPTANLDPRGIVQVREVLFEQRAEGRTILVSSHLLAEVEHVADRAIIMRDGAKVQESTISSLRSRQRTERIVEVEVIDVSPLLIESLGGLPFVTGVNQRDRVLQISTPGTQDYRDEIGRHLQAEGVAVRGMKTVESTLEEAFLSITAPKAKKSRKR